jgi:hypothetical protein
MGALENRGGIAGTIAARVVGMAWSLVAFLAVPVIAIGVALYRYALDGEVVGGFTAENLESAVEAKGGPNAPPTATPGTV